MHTLRPSAVNESQTAKKQYPQSDVILILRLHNSLPWYKFVLPICVTRNTAVIPTTVFFTNRFRGSISFLSKQYASIIAPAAKYSLNNPGNYSLLPWCNECTHNGNDRLVTNSKFQVQITWTSFMWGIKLFLCLIKHNNKVIRAHLHAYLSSALYRGQ
jgi:hypothetical protein